MTFTNCLLMMIFVELVITNVLIIKFGEKKK